MLSRGLTGGPVVDQHIHRSKFKADYEMKNILFLMNFLLQVYVSCLVARCAILTKLFYRCWPKKKLALNDKACHLQVTFLVPKITDWRPRA